jgi:hypothetical protein
MLSKVEYSNINFATDQIKEYCKNKINIIKIQDNLKDSLLVKTKEITYLFNYKNNKTYFYDKIQIEFNGHIIIKHIDSFDQNNILVANKLRKYVLSLLNTILVNNYNTILGNTILGNTIIGIGGEYYLYFPFIKATNYIGMSNHQSIIDDAKYNVPYSINYLVDYNDYNKLPVIKSVNIILVNLFNININIIYYISKIECNKIILISCNLPDSKLLLIQKYFKIISIKTFSNLSGFIKVFQLVRKL